LMFYAKHTALSSAIVFPQKYEKPIIYFQQFLTRNC
jgi:hypothetical protein